MGLSSGSDYPAELSFSLSGQLKFDTSTFYGPNGITCNDTRLGMGDCGVSCWNWWIGGPN